MSARVAGFDAADLSLREALALAELYQGSDIITFDASLTAAGSATISLTMFDTGLDSSEFGPTALVINSNITIQGATGANGITIAEAARLLRVPEGWLRKKVTAGLVPHTRIGKHVRFTNDHLRRVIAAGEVQTAASPDQPRQGLSPRARRTRPAI